MKKNYITLIAVLTLIIGIGKVSAITIKPSGDTTGKIGDEILIYITINKEDNESSISSIDGILNYDSNIFTLINSESLMNNWTELSNISNNKIFSYANISFDNLIKETNVDIIRSILKIKENANFGETTISISNQTATDEKGNGISITGGNHIVKILSNKNSLSNIILSEGTINFKENTLNYEVKVSNNIEKITIEATLSDESASFVNNYGPKEVDLAVGDNLIEIKVRAESSEIKTYTLVITREKKEDDGNLDDNDKPTDKDDKHNENDKPKKDNNKSSNNYLKYLKPSYGTIVFDKTKMEYYINVPYEVTKIEFQTEAEDNKSDININGGNLEVGNNQIIISVKAEDGNVRNYKIQVVRNQKEIILSSDNKLKDLIIEKYDIEFDSDIYEYNIKIKNEKYLNITYILSDEKSNVSIVGNKDLKDKSFITITVVAEDSSAKSYVINIDKSGYKKTIISIAISLVTILIIVSITMFTTYKRKKQS